MDQHDTGATRRTLLVSGAFGALTAMVGLPQRAAAAAAPYSEQERDAVKVCRDFISAFASRDPDQLATFLSDDVQSRGNPTSPVVSGRDALVEGRKKFLAGPIAKGLTYGGMTEAFAVGGATGTAVLTKRVNYRIVGGKKTPVALAAMFWVVDGKIHAWYDFPLAPPARARA